MNIRLRLLLGFGNVMALLVVVGVFAAYRVDLVHDMADSLYNHPFTVMDSLHEADTHVIKMHRGMKDAVMAQNSSELEAAVSAVNASEKVVYERLTVAKERFLGNKNLIDDIVKELDAWKPIRAKAIALLRANKKNKAVEVHREQAAQAVANIEKSMGNVLEFARNKAVSYMKSAKELEDSSYRWTFLMLVLSTIFALVISLTITRSIVRPLRTAVEVADRMAAGDMSSEIKEFHNDETGRLLRSMDNMVKSFKGLALAADRIGRGDIAVEIVPLSDRDILGKSMETMVKSLSVMAHTADRIAAGDLTVSIAPNSEKDVLGNALANMIKNLREQTRDISEAINILASSVSQIMASSTEIASSSSETAAAVSETTSTVEQVRQTAQIASQKAQYVSESSKKVVDTSQIGYAAVEETVQGMSEIRQQMESIAESIVRLSEQSQTIGEIISSVNDIAEQSNLLAVNAAIEAAKAGEQGKGFTVVAQEVRSLAEQSKQATAQVRTILNDIQKATGKAVMVTEQGGKAVESGVKQSGEAGSAIHLLAKNVSDTSQAAIQIVASSQQQLVGMDQVALAMENIKQASIQNAESIRQVETASRNLNETVQKLKQMAGRYRL
jgi:methyl-accepting chemotaxis protein